MKLGKLIFQNLFWKGLYMVTIFIINIIIARYFKASGSGSIFYTINNLSFALLILSLSLESGITFYVARREIAAEKVFCLSVIWPLVASTGFIFFFEKAGGFISITDYSNSVLIGIFCYSLGILLITYFSNLFGAFKEFRIPNLILIAVNMVVISILVYYYFKRTNGNASTDDQVLSVYLCSFTAQGILLSLVFARRFVSNFKLSFPSSEEFKKLLNFSKLALVINIIFFLVYRVDYWFVARFCTDEQLGNYIQVSKIVQVFLLIPSMIAMVIFPVTAAEIKTKMSEHIPIVARLLFWLYLLLLAFLMVTGEKLFSLVYGTSFRYMYPVFLLVVPGILALSIQALITAYYAGRNLLMNNLKGALVALVIIVPGDILFIPSYGIYGAAVVSSLGYISYMAYMMYIFKKDNQVLPLNFFFLKNSDWQWLKEQVMINEPGKPNGR